MPFTIQLPEPCAENWHLMTPKQRGRHCDQCSKTVVDFTNWPPESILFYLQTNAGACGRFRVDQLDTPIPSPDEFTRFVAYSPLSIFKKIAAIILFVFGMLSETSCREEQITGRMESLKQASPVDSMQHGTPGPDTLPMVNGGVKLIDTKPEVQPKTARPQEVRGNYYNELSGVPPMPQEMVLQGDTIIQLEPKDSSAHPIK